MMLITAVKEVICKGITAEKHICVCIHALGLFLEPKLQDEPNKDIVKRCNLAHKSKRTTKTVVI